MTAAQFVDLQEALIGVFAPWALWWFAALMAGGILLAVLWIWQGLLRWLTKGDS